MTNRENLEKYCADNDLNVQFIIDDFDDETSYYKIRISYRYLDKYPILFLEDHVPNVGFEQLSECMYGMIQKLVN
jgi:hypothetical protein